MFYDLCLIWFISCSMIFACLKMLIDKDLDCLFIYVCNNKGNALYLLCIFSKWFLNGLNTIISKSIAWISILIIVLEAVLFSMFVDCRIQLDWDLGKVFMVSATAVVTNPAPGGHRNDTNKQSAFVHNKANFYWTRLMLSLIFI